MSLDTAEKRLSVMNVTCGLMLPLFEPEGSGVNPDDRLHLLGRYGGLFETGHSPGSFLGISVGSITR